MINLMRMAEFQVLVFSRHNFSKVVSNFIIGLGDTRIARKKFSVNESRTICLI